MPIPNSDFDSIVRHLKSLGLHTGHNVSVHSKLLSFGFIKGGAAIVYKALRQIVGPEGTLVFPAYTLNLGPQDVYDPRNTPPVAMGALSEYVWTLPDVLRSDSPLHGHLATGPLAARVVEADPCKSMGQGSSFSVMRRLGFKLLMLGCSFQEGATFVHHVESEVGVPYRNWLKLNRIRKCQSGSLLNMTCHYYGHIHPGRYENNLTLVELEMAKQKKMSIVQAPIGKSYFMSLEKIYSCVSQMLSNDQYVLVKPVKGDE
ncbi:AAC(3) family N-acetyltransferase [Desulfoluna butyratoxydans]|uniref:Aminoglycoside N(3)-acetyltransferase n=1 Tax=Desulfoluna butyratoxydans TaxID=231438 RepID=A0A4U8YQN0_9BACT|nr:AAC(3) family N-acetyltransferase [Desulfoluna butyratoxydans]VFQ46150.1 aminoglycoside n(3)-acetyltransferase [Desulfoluna butyratoxydans]